MGGKLSGVTQLSPEQRRVLEGSLDVTARLVDELDLAEHRVIVLKETLAWQRRNNGRLWCTRDTLGDLTGLDLGPEAA